MKKLLLLFILSSTSVFSQEVITATYDTILLGDSTTLTDVVNTSFSWSNSATTQSITVSPTVNTTYEVIRTTNGHTDSASITIYVDIDVDAQAYFDSVTDLNPLVKVAINNRIKAFKANGTWSGLKGCLISAPTLDALNSLIDLKTRVSIGSFANGSGVSYTNPYNEVISLPSTIGYTFNGGIIKTGMIPSSLMTLNNSAFAVGILDDEPIKTTFNLGALNTNAQTLLFMNRFTGNQILADSYNVTSGQGRLVVTGVNGNKGVKIVNRQSTTSFRVNDNGTVTTSTGSGGSLPTYEIYLNCYNNAGGAPSARRNGSMDFFCIYGSSLTNAQEAQELTDWQSFKTAMKRTGGQTKQVVCDGNSFTTYYMQKITRTIDYKLFGGNWKITNVGVSGQTISSLIGRQNAYVKPLYDSTFTKNIYFPFEMTNEMFSGSSLDSCKVKYTRACTNAQNFGYKVIAMPMCARYYSGNVGGLSETAWNLKVNDFNVWVSDSTNWSTFADDFCDFPSSNYFVYRSSYGSDSAYNTAINSILNNTTYYQTDKLHLKELGFYEWGVQIYNAIIGL